MNTTQDPKDDNNTVEKQPTRKSVSLTSGEGLKLMKLTILARRAPSGRSEMIVTLTDVAKKKSTNGMRKKFDNFDLALEALMEVEKDAIKKGWRKVERVGGFKPRPDAFSSIPPAAKGGK
jgi:hypothetical protein